jgi:hypothetical protein
MRYYTIRVTGLDGEIWPVRYENGGQWGSHVNGVADPGAQQVEFHIPEYDPTTPKEGAVITIQGVMWEQIIHTDDLMGKPITVYGGLAPGLELATLQSRKAGLLLQGQIIRAWGNWIGSDMSISMTFVVADNKEDSGGGDQQGGGGSEQDPTGGGQIDSPAMARQRLRANTRTRTGFRSIDNVPYARGRSAPFGSSIPVATPFDVGGGTIGGGDIGSAVTSVGGMVSSLFGGGANGLQSPLNLIHNMMPNMKLSSAIQQTLSTAFGGKGGANVAISDALKLNYQDAGMYQNMEQYAGYIQKLSQSILGVKNYPGVMMRSKGEGMNVFDGSKPDAIGTGVIEYFDLIGQPVWIDINKIQVKCILRGDITGGMEVSLPTSIAAIAAGPSNASPGAAIAYTASPQRFLSSLTGKGLVIDVLHIGDFRNPDGVGWSTTYTMLYPSGAGGPYSGAADAAKAVENSSQQQDPQPDQNDQSPEQQTPQTPTEPIPIPPNLA